MAKKKVNSSLSSGKRGRGRPKGSTSKTKLSPKKSVSKKVKSKPKSKSKSKYKKKSGRKPSAPNRYNEIKKGISEYYQNSVGRKVKRYEIKVIYQWVKDNYSNQSLKYVIMNLDVILDTFWKEYCNLYPVNLEYHARFFDWYYFKNYIYEESEYHYPTDIIQVDLTQVGAGIFEFFMEDYTSKVEELYQIGKSAGLKDMKGVYPKYYLKNAYCDVAKRGNVFEYVLLVDGEIPDETTTISSDTPPMSPPTTPPTPPTPPTTPPPTAPPVSPIPTQDIRGIINDLRQDLKDGIISKEIYEELLKDLIRKLYNGGEV